MIVWIEPQGNDLGLFCWLAEETVPRPAENPAINDLLPKRLLRLKAFQWKLVGHRRGHNTSSGGCWWNDEVCNRDMYKQIKISALLNTEFREIISLNRMVIMESCVSTVAWIILITVKMLCQNQYIDMFMFMKFCPVSTLLIMRPSVVELRLL